MDLLVRDSDSFVWGFGSNMAAPSGFRVYRVDAPTTAAYLAAIAAAGGSGATFTAPSQNQDGTWTGTVTALAPPPAPTPPPATTVAAGAGAGTSPPAPTLLSGDPGTSTDVRGVLVAGSGASPTASANGHYMLATISFGTPYPMAPVGILLQAIGASTAVLGNLYPDELSPTGFSIWSTLAPTASQPVGTFKVGYAIA